MKILVGSKNPVKVNAVKEAFEKFYDSVEAVGISVPSGVSDQPINDETFEGAKNRAAALKKINEEQNLEAQYFVGLEGGIIELYKKWFCFGGMCIMDAHGKTAFGNSPHFELPEQITKQLFAGVELGHVMDALQKKENTKQSGGAVAFFTKGAIDRTEFYVSGLVMALVPFLNTQLYHG